MRFLIFIVAISLAPLVSGFPLNLTQPGTIPGTTSHYSEVRGHTYHYLLAEPSSELKGTVLLVHGLPDISYGWRYQVPALTALGYRVIAPDMLGYAGTDSPSSLTHWTHKELATDMVNLVGHDWGAGLVYKIAMWYPDFVKAFFTIAVPYMPPWLGLSTDWKDLSELVADGTFPTLGYQLQWRDPSIDRNFTTPSQIRMMFNTVFGGTTPEGDYGYSISEGFLYDVMPLLEPNPLVNSSDMDLYVNSIAKHGVRGVFNWYRTRRMDWEDELPLAKEGTFRFKMPSLFIPALKDISMSEGYYRNMPEHFDSLAIQAVDAGHWTHWEGREEVNEILAGWVKSLN
ncbi:unnamed protein product [Clonostachys rosea]|uniref:AB hydrolase-1 domain-containing protein n=1 Tax=Bionectria ochroleuca TaxID=29856 RepID=A0ABY6UW00_BIOOC|nr:unnamed protein product [Clonostachys rosea]